MLTSKRLHEILRYDPITGIFHWKVNGGRRAKIGSIAGTITDGGYRRIRIEGNCYRAHRLAWLYMTGDWPDESIDHINRDRSDNRWRNLREANNSQNQVNSRQRSSRTGIRGVDWIPERGYYRARLRKNGKTRYLGNFSTADAAQAAYQSELRRLFGQYAPA